jgi:hypothetical protein
MCDPKYDPTSDKNQGKVLGTLAGLATGNPLFALAGNMAGDALIDKPKEALDLQKQANQTAKDAAIKNADQADQAFNRANGKQPDIMSMMGQNTLNAKGGQSGTMLTGVGGIDPSTLLLGKKTLLGA